jgi:hydroxymethylpyrimidine kinase/phosphomethylpyrimidine kinase/thiamine-phosphate diphosphorylase
MLSSGATQAKRPIAWSVAGSDSGGGAGIQADLRAMHALGAHCCTIITALTAQSSVGVAAVEHAPIDSIRATVEALEPDLFPKAIKLGMLGTEGIMLEISRFLRRYDGPVVCDPVMVSTSGSRLMSEGAQSALVSEILPRSALVTPNRMEAEALLGRKLSSPADVEAGAEELLRMGVEAVLVKGGHMVEDCDAVSQDYYRHRDGTSAWISGPRIPTGNTHGTGCTLSSAIAACLAQDLPMLDAIVVARAYVSQGIRFAQQLGKGPGPVAQTCWPNSWEDFPWVTHSSEEGLAHGRLDFPACHWDWGVYPVVPDASWVRKLAPYGLRDIQLRVKGEDAKSIDKQVEAAAAFAKEAGVRLWVNDYWEPAIKHGVYGVHIGQEDLEAAGRHGLEAMAAAGIRLGISTHSYSELSLSLGVRPSYISLGPVYPTASKHVAYSPQGTEMVRRWRALVDPKIPLVTIGGISLERAPQVLESGAQAIAVIAAITQASDPGQAMEQWNCCFETRGQERAAK